MLKLQHVKSRFGFHAQPQQCKATCGRQGQNNAVVEVRRILCVCSKAVMDILWIRCWLRFQGHMIVLSLHVLKAHVRGRCCSHRLRAFAFPVSLRKGFWFWWFCQSCWAAFICWWVPSQSTTKWAYALVLPPSRSCPTILRPHSVREAYSQMLHILVMFGSTIWRICVPIYQTKYIRYQNIHPPLSIPSKHQLVAPDPWSRDQMEENLRARQFLYTASPHSRRVRSWPLVEVGKKAGDETGKTQFTRPTIWLWFSKMHDTLGLRFSQSTHGSWRLVRLFFAFVQVRTTIALTLLRLHPLWPNEWRL